MRSLYAGVSGLQNHQLRMDVIGNNVANVNTTGFKKSRVNFQDMLSQMISGAARPTDEVGGVNPKQVGLGMLISSIDTIHTQGSVQTTGNKTDLSIMGDGFFIVKDGDREFYTRAGAFSIDEEGLLVNPANGRRVQGWAAQTVAGEVSINTASDLTDLIIPVYGKDMPRTTTEVIYRSNLDQRTEAPPLGEEHVSTMQIYDSLGNTHELRLTFSKIADVNNQWQVAVTVDGADAIAELGGGASTSNLFTINFDTQGRILSAVDSEGDTIDAGQLLVGIVYDIPGAEPLNFNLNLGTAGEFNGITQTADVTTTKSVEQNGYGLGYLVDFQIDQSGVITGVYSNGANRMLGQVALATFTNPGGLEKAGENTYVLSNNSGNPLIGPSGTEGKGKILSGTLEMSNVDLAEQFVDMIITQRGFQANSRTITTSDQMLQELLTLKR